MKNVPFKIWSTLPDKIRNPLDILRRCPQWKASGVVFIHVPKAAGVSVSRAIYGRTLGHFQASDVRRVCPNTFGKLLTFGVVRHPIDRLYSAYHFAHAGGTSEMGMNNHKLYQSDLFSSFDKFVCDWLSKQNVEEVDGVFKPQHLFLCDDDEIIVDKVIKLGEIEQGMQEISDFLGRKIVLGHHNKFQSSQLTVASVETLSIIKCIYQKDFDIFNFNMDEMK